jgi:hypothetical protein
MSSKVKTILLSSLSSVVSGFFNCQAKRMFFFMDVFEKGRLDKIFPIRVREGGRGGLFVAFRIGVAWSMQCRPLVWVISSFMSLFIESIEKRQRLQKLQVGSRKNKGRLKQSFGAQQFLLLVTCFLPKWPLYCFL